MDTSAESYELAFRGKRDRKRDRKPTKRRVVKRISSSEIKTTADDAQHLSTSLLGLPKELLNHIVELAVVQNPDEGPVEANVEFKRLKGRGSRHAFRCETPSPALGRTCRALEAIVLPIYHAQNTFSFRSHYHASRWLSLTRRRQGLASIRRVKILFDVFGSDDEKTLVEMELFLEDETDSLALAVDCSFYAHACQKCRRLLMDKIADTNGSTRQYKSGVERLLALLRRFSKKTSSKGWICGTCDCERL